MEGCGSCGPQLANVELNDDGITYDIHLATTEGHQLINVDAETLARLGDAIQISLFLTKELETVYFDEGDEL